MEEIYIGKPFAWVSWAELTNLTRWQDVWITIKCTFLCWCSAAESHASTCLTPMLRPLHPKCASVKQSQRDTSYQSLQAAEWGMESEQHAGRGLSAPRYLVPGKNPSRPEAWAWALPQKDQTLRQADISGHFIVVVAIIIQILLK